MANPNNAIGTNAAFGGRTSPNAFNDVLGAFQSRGILSGWACSPDSGMSVVLGGGGTNRDVAIAEDNAGNKTTVNNISGSPVSVTIGAAPASQSRIDAIVVYIENPPQGTATATDNYGTVGVLDVQGNTASTPVAPNESAIRTAITADGASGATAYYVVLAYVTVASGTTDITSEMITAGDSAILQSELTNIPANTITTSMIQNGAVTSNKIDWTTITTEALTPNTTYVDYSTYSKYMKFGRMVIVYINCYFKAGASGNTDVFSGLPATSNRVSIVLADNTNRVYRARILENTTNIQVEGGFNSGVYVSGNFVYFADN